MINQNYIKGYWIPTTTSAAHEEWFTYSYYIAEFWSTLSCIGFFMVSYIGLVYGNQNNTNIYYAVALCGFASVLSHITVKRSMLWFDYFGVFCNGLAMLMNMDAVMVACYKTNILYAALFTVFMGICDVFNKYYAKRRHSLVHSVWHLSVAFTMSYFI
jgi:hypothetical protein